MFTSRYGLDFKKSYYLHKLKLVRVKYLKSLTVGSDVLRRPASNIEGLLEGVQDLAGLNKAGQ